MYFFVLAIAVFSTLVACARQGITKNKTAAGKKEQPVTYRILLLPDFYHYRQTIVNDTVFQYVCSRKHMDVNADTLRTIDDVDEIKYTKNFYQYSNTAGGAISAPYLTKTLFDYDRDSHDTWIKLDKLTRNQTDVKEDRNKIIRADTVTITNRQTGITEHVIHRYYKTMEQGAADHGHRDE